MKTKVDFTQAEMDRIEGMLKDPLLDDIVFIMNQQLENQWIGDGGKELDDSLSWAFTHHLPDLYYSIGIDSDHLKSEFHPHHWKYTVDKDLPSYFKGYLFGFLPYFKSPLQKKRIENYMDPIIGPSFNSKDHIQRRWFNQFLQKSCFPDRFVTLLKDKGFECKITNGACSVTVRVIVQ